MPDHFKIKERMEGNKKSCLSGQVAYFADSPADFWTHEQSTLSVICERQIIICWDV